DDTARLTFHEKRTVLLEIQVDGSSEVLSRYGKRIVASILVWTLDDTVLVAKQIPHTACSAKVGFIVSFQSALADVVTLPVELRGVISELILGNLTDIADSISNSIGCISSGSPRLNVQTFELVDVVLDLGEVAI